MAELKDGFDFLAKLQEKTGKEYGAFSTLERFLDQKARKMGIPLTGQFELTPLCNFDCKMCYSHLTADQLRDRAITTTEQWKDLMHQAWEMGMYNIVLTGGECLAYPGFKEIYLYLHELGCEITVLTNGALLDEHWIEFFKEHRPASIRITIYGNNEDVYERVTGHKNFSKVMEHVMKIKEAGLPLRLSVTPNRFLGDSVYDTIRLAKKTCKSVMVSSGLFDAREETGRAGQENDLSQDDYLRIYQLVNELDGRQNIEIPEDQLPAPGGPVHECAECGLPCGGGRSAFVVDWKGTMRPCYRLQDVQSHPFEVGFKEAWRAINEVASSWPAVPECDGCAYASACTRCAATMLRYAEPGKQPLGMCEKVRFFVQHGVWQIQDC